MWLIKDIRKLEMFCDSIWTEWLSHQDSTEGFSITWQVATFHHIKIEMKKILSFFLSFIFFQLEAWILVFAQNQRPLRKARTLLSIIFEMSDATVLTRMERTRTLLTDIQQELNQQAIQDRQHPQVQLDLVQENMPSRFDVNFIFSQIHPYMCPLMRQQV